MKRSGTIRVVGLLAAMAMLFAACGSDDDDGAAAEPTAAAEDTNSDGADGSDAPASTDTSASDDDPEAPSCRAALVTGAGGLGDQSFNDSANAGFERARDELGVDIEVIESAADTDVELNLIDAAADGVDVAFAIGFQMVDPVTNASAEHPDTTFGIVDAVVDQPNVASLVFNEPEGSFLAGVVAGSVSETGTIGFVGGLEIPLIEGFYAGYAAGARSVDPDIEVLLNYAGAFDDPGRGKEIALSEYGDGADVIFHAAGGTGLGVFEAANETGNWVIGVDADQSGLAPDYTLTSMMKRVDNAVFATIESVCDGSFSAGTQVFGLSEDGVGLAESTANNTPADVIAVADDFRQRIIDGEIKVPTSAAELDSFTPPSG